MRFFRSCLLLSAVLGVASAFSTFCSGQDDSQSNAFNVMSFNVRLATKSDGDNYWDNRKETLVEVVKESDRGWQRYWRNYGNLLQGRRPRVA